MHLPRLGLSFLAAVLGAGPLFAQASPPPQRSFGPDTTATGVFTGAGTTPLGLTCTAAQPPMECSGFYASDVDGTELDLTVRVPDAPTPRPLVVHLHGYGGSKHSDPPAWDDELVSRGYAVLRYSARGFGESWGQVNLADVDVEVRDLQSLIGQLVDDPQVSSAINPDAVAITGTSYGGGQSWLAALAPTFQSPAGAAIRIRTVVPIAPWTDLLYSLRPNGRPTSSIDVPGFYKVSYLEGLFAGGIRTDPARPYPNYPGYLVSWNTYALTTEPNNLPPLGSQIVDGVAGYRSIWWQSGFFQQVAANARAGTPQLPVLVFQGFTDDLFPLPEALRMYRTLKFLDPSYPIAVYLGDIGHPRAQNKPAEVQYALDRLFEWLDFYLQGIGTASSSCGGPAPQLRCDVLAAITRPGDGFDPGDVLRVDSIDALATATVKEKLAGDATLTFNPANLGAVFSDPFVMAACEELQTGCLAPPPDEIPGDVATYTLPASRVAADAGMQGSFLVAGQPQVRMQASTAAPRVQLDVRLFDDKSTGESVLLTRGTYTLDAGALPIGTTDVRIPTYGNLLQVDATDTLRLEITNVDSPYIMPSRVPSVTQISGVHLDLPLRPAP